MLSPIPGKKEKTKRGGGAAGMRTNGVRGMEDTVNGIHLLSERGELGPLPLKEAEEE